MKAQLYANSQRLNAKGYTYYHPDHLGSTSFITDTGGEVSQHEEYIPFGESLVSEHANNGYNAPWKFNGKEFDEDSRLYYYGARYYDPRISIWMGVDPLIYDGTFLAGKHNGGFYNSFNHGSYIYCYQSPVVLVDPNGKQTEAPYTKGQTFTTIENGKSYTHQEIEVNVHNYTLSYETEHNRYFYSYNNTNTVTRLKSSNPKHNTWIGASEYNYTVFLWNGNSLSQPFSIASQDLKGGNRYILPGIMKNLFNPYDLDQYRNTRNSAEKLKVMSSTSGSASSWANLVGKSSLSKRLGFVSLALQFAGTSVDMINSMQIGEQKEAFKILYTDTFDAVLGEIITKDKAGLIYDALGQPYYNKIKSTLLESINSDKSSSKGSK